MTDAPEEHELAPGTGVIPETRLIGCRWVHATSTGSTNDDLKAEARAGAPEGLVLSADEQMAGRGRRGRNWSAPAGSSLLLSALLRPVWLPPDAAFFLTMLAAVASAEAIERVLTAQVGLKWPNDLEIAGRKTGGILIESEIESGHLQWAIAGIGINVNWDPASIAELAPRATSLAREAGHPISRRTLLHALVGRLDDHYAALRAGARTGLFRTWRDRLTTIGNPVQAEVGGRHLDGYAEDVTPHGALLVRDQKGRLHELTAGDVTVRTT